MQEMLRMLPSKVVDLPMLQFLVDKYQLEFLVIQNLKNI